MNFRSLVVLAVAVSFSTLAAHAQCPAASQAAVPQSPNGNLPNRNKYR